MCRNRAGRSFLRRHGRVLGPLGLLLFTGCTLQSLLYPAPPVRVPSPPPAPLSEVVWDHPGGYPVVGWFMDPPADDGTVVLFFHGNGENLETMRMAELFEEMRLLDIGFVAVDYPGYGRSGGEPSESSLMAAAEQAFGWAAERWPDSRRVVAGWSLGAAVAVQLAASRPEAVDGLVALSPWATLKAVAEAHFPSFLVSVALRERYDSLAVAGRVECPSLVIHGAEDELISADQGRQLAAALPSARWIELPRVGHNDLMGQWRVWREMTGFLAEIGGERGAEGTETR